MFNNSWQAIYIQQIKLKCVFLGKKIDVSFSLPCASNHDTMRKIVTNAK